MQSLCKLRGECAYLRLERSPGTRGRPQDKRSPFLMRRFIRKRIEDGVASRGRTHVTEADVDESAMYRQYRFK